MGIGDWAQSPIPNPQSQSPINFRFITYYILLRFLFNIMMVKNINDNIFI